MSTVGAVSHAAPPSQPPPEGPDPTREKSRLWDGDGFDFGDLLDVVNPLQHIPVISTLYRELTGDDIGYGPRVAGGALFGGVIGLIASVVNVMIEDGTGKDIGGHAVALLFGDDADGIPVERPAQTMVARADAFVRMGEGASAAAALQIGLIDPAAAAPPSAVAAAPAVARPVALLAMNDSVRAPDAAPPPPAPLDAGRQDRFNLAMKTEPAPSAPERGRRAGPADLPGRALESRFDAALAVDDAPGPWLPAAMRYGLDHYATMARDRARAGQVDAHY